MQIKISDPELDCIYQLIKSIPDKEGMANARKDSVLSELVDHLIFVDVAAAREIVRAMNDSTLKTASCVQIAEKTLDHDDIATARRQLATSQEPTQDDRQHFEARLCYRQHGEEALKIYISRHFRVEDHDPLYAFLSAENRPDWLKPPISEEDRTRYLKKWLERFEQSLQLAVKTDVVFFLMELCRMIARIGCIEQARNCLERVPGDVEPYMDNVMTGMVHGFILRGSINEAQKVADGIVAPDARARAQMYLYVERKRGH